MKYIIFTLFALLLFKNSGSAQCSYTIKPLDGTTFCAGSTIRFTTFQNTPVTDTLYWDLNGDGFADAQGDTATYIFPANSIGQTYNVGLSLGTTNIPCDVQVVNTTPSVDPTVTFQGGQQRCNGTQNVTIRIFNASTTLAQNSNYTVNWGDGSPNYSAPTLSSTTGLAHTYTTFGYKYITVTVAGSAGFCAATRVYTFYNGTNPSVGLANPGATTGLCVPATLTFPVTSTVGNTIGTTYALKISGQLVQTFTHPPPTSVSYTFTQTSCGQTSLGGYANAFDVRLEAYNACDTTAATIEPIRLSEPPVAMIAVTPPATNCPGSVWTFTNTSLGQDAAGSSCSRPAVQWSILTGTEFVNWQIVNGNTSSNTVGVQILTGGQFAIRIVTSSNSCGSDSTTLVLNPLVPPAVNVSTVFSNSANGNGAHCAPSTVFFNAATTGDSTRVEWHVSPATGWAFANGTNDTTRNVAITFSQAGSYNISVSVINACDTITWDTLLVFSGVPIVTLTSPPNTCNTANLALSPANATYNANGGVITGYTWTFPGGTPNTSNQQYPNGIVYNSPGTYIYYVTATSLCGNATASASLIIETPPAINVTTTTGDVDVCKGSPPVALVGTPAGGVWSGTGVVGNTFDPNTAGVVLGNNTLTYTYSPAAGCGNSATLLLNVQPPPTVTASIPTVCRGTTLSLTATMTPSAGGVFAWAGPGGFVSNIQSPTRSNAQPTMAGTYTVTATDANGCTASTTRTAVINNLPNANAGPAQTTCSANTSLQLNGAPTTGGTGVWSNSPFITSNGVFNPNAAGVGTYTVRYTFTSSTTGCSKSATTTVTVTPNPVASAGADTTICADIAPFTIYGNPSGGVWSGQPFITATGTIDPIGLSPNNYTLTYTINGGTLCEASDTRTLTILPLPTPSATAATICESKNLQLNCILPFGGTGGGFNWAGPAAFTSNQQNPVRTTAQLTMAGIYTVTATDASGCSATATALALINPQPNTSAGAPQTICATATTLQLNGTPTTGGTGVWSGSFVNASGVFDPIAAGIGTYVMTYTFTNNGTNCSKIATTTVTVQPNPTPNSGADTSICRNSPSFVLYANISGGVYSGTGVSGNTFNPSGLAPANYTITYTLFGGTPCQLTDTRVITILPLPVPTATTTAVCQSATLSLSATISPPLGGGGFNWAGPLGFSSTVQNPVRNNAQVNMSGVYTVTTTASNGCTASKTVAATVNPQPNTSAGAPQSICATAVSLQLNGSPITGGSGTWSGSFVTVGGLFDPVAASIGSHTVYYTFVNNGTGCSKSASTTITVTPNPTPNTGLDTSVCRNSGAFNLYADISGGVWSGTNITGNTFNPLGLTPANYTITYTIFGGTPCELNDTRTITINPLPNAGASALPVCVGASLQLNGANSNSSGTDTYAWAGTLGFIAATQNPIRNNMTLGMNGLYTVTVTNQFGCKSSKTVNVVVNPLPNPSAGAPQSICATAPAVQLNGTPTLGGSGVWTNTVGGTFLSASGVFDPVAAGVGNYTVIYTFTDGTTGCSKSANTNVTVTPNPPPDGGLDTLICRNSPAFSLYGLPSGGAWSGTNVSNGVFDPTSLAAGNYTLNYTIFAATPCELTDTRTITILPLPSVTATAPAVCRNTNLSLTANGGIGYSWLGPNGYSASGQTIVRNNAQPTMAGTYTVTATDANGCKNTATIAASIIPLPNTNAGVPQNICATAAPITLVGTPQSGGVGVWSGNVNITPQGIFDPIAAGVGTYNVVYTFTDGTTACSKSATTTITVTPNPLPDPGIDTTICLNSQPIALVGFPTGGVWTGSGVSGTSFSTAGLTTGNYTVTYTVLGGTPCELSNTRTFTILGLPTPTANIPRVCQAANLVLNATGGVIYAWQGAAAFVSNAQSPIRGNAQPNMSGNYTVTVTDLNGCTASATATALVVPSPVVSAGAPQSICETAAALQLNGSPLTGGSGVWSGAFVSPLGVFNPTAAGIGTYLATYTFTDATTTCSKAATTTIAVTPNPLPNAGQDTLVCLGSPSITLVGSPSGGVWSGTGVSGNFFNLSNLSTGNYTLTYTINQGTPCALSNTKTITIAPLPIPSISANTVCRGFDLVLTSSGGNTYNWAGPAFFSSILQNPTRGNAQLNMAGAYTVTVTDVNRCTASISAIAVINQLPIVGAGAPQSICETATPIQLNGSPTTGGSGAWSGGAFISPSGAFDPIAAGVGTYVVVYTFTSALTQCSNSATTTVSVTPNPAPDADIDVAVCFGSPLFALGGSPAGGTWTGTGVTANTFNPLGLAVGSYVLTYTINGGTPCQLQDQKTVTIQPLPIVVTGNNAPICAGDTLRLTATAGNTYAWTGPDNFSSTIGNPIRANATVAMSGTYTVTVTDSNNCVNSSTTSVIINPLPVVNAGPSRSNCNTVLNDTIVGFTPTSGGTGVWSGSQFVSTSGIFTVRNTPVGAYILTYTFTNTNNCVNSDTMRITVYDNPLANAGLDFSICNNALPATLVGTPAGGDWTGQNVSNGTFNPVGLAPGVYPLIYYTFRGQRCETRDTVLATVFPLPTPTATNNSPICAGFDVTLVATGGQNFSWLGANNFTSIVFNPTIIAASVNASGTYTVTVTDANNCTNTITTEVLVYPLPLVTTAPTLDLCNTIQNYQLTGFAPISGSTGTGVWSGPFVSPSGLFTVAGTAVGGYNLTYTFTDLNGCINSADQVVNVYNNPIADAGPDGSICNNLSPIPLNATPSGGVWTGSGVSNGFFDPRGLAAGIYDLVYQTFPGLLCQTADTMRMTVLPLPVASAQNTSPYCVNDAISLQASGGNNYEWSGPVAFTSLVQSPSIPSASLANAGIYTVTVTDANLCTNSATTNVIIRPLPIVDAGPPQTVCNTWTSIQVNGAATSAGIGTWSGTGVSPSGVFSVQGLPVGNYFLTYTFTDNVTTCVNTDTVTITIIPNIAADAGIDQEICFGASPIPLAGTPIGGTWTGTGVFNNTFSPAGLQPGDYTLYYNLGLTNCFTKDSMVMTIKPLPVLSAIANTPCANGDLQFLLTTTPAQTYAWAGPLGFSSSAPNPNINPAPLAAAGVYTVTVVGLNGCSNTTSLLAGINPLPNVTAGNDASICRNNAPYTLTGYSPTTGGTGSWSGVGVTANGIFDPNQAAGTYTLTYTFTNGNGCVNKDSMVFLITPNTVPLVGNDTSVCINSGLIVLAATPANGIWTGAGIQNNLFNPQAAGFGTHTLTYTTNTGTICALSDVLVITVNPLPVVSAGLDRVVCVSEPNVTLQGIPTGGTWSGSAGAVIANNIFSPQQSGAGIYTMVYFYNNSNNCSKSDTMIFRVNPLPIVVTRDTSFCNAFGLVPLPSAVPLGGTWTGAGVIPPLSFAPTAVGVGTHLVTYTFTDANGCVNTATSGITVTPIPIVNAGPNDTICIDGGIRNMTGQIPATGGFWTGNGITNPNVGVFDPLVAGAGTWTLTYSYGVGNCRTSDTKIVTVVDIRQVFAGPDQDFCVSAPPFSLTSYSPTGGRWVGRGITNPIAGTYSPAIAGVGVDTLYYTYTDALSQCSFTDSKLMTINPLPNPQFAMPDTICINTNFTISNQTFGAAFTLWTFGDGTSSTDLNPAHSYTTEGTYPIKLVVRNPFGCIDSLRKNITVLRPPFAQAIVTTPDICESTPIQLTNQSSGFGIRYFWQLPTGASDTARTPAPFVLPAYPRDTVVNVFLTVSNRCGVSVDTIPIRVRPAPHVALTPDRADICSGSLVYFQNLSTGGATQFLWDLGNGNTFSGLIPPPQLYYTDTLPRTYTVKLVASNQCGVDSVSYPLLIKPANVRAFVYVNTTRGCGPLTVQFQDFSTSTIVGIAFTHNWNFGDGGTSTDPNPIHTFSQPGNYTIIEYVGTNCGTDTDTVRVEVLPPPDVSFTPPAYGCAKQTAQFLNTSTTPMASFWQFSDGDTTSVASPYKAFLAPGNYTVTLTGTSQYNGCTASAISTVEVKPNPTPTFSIQGTQGCRPLAVSLVNGTNNGSNFIWQFGDGNSSTAINPNHRYDTSGTFIVRLKAYDVFGCYADTAMAIVNVYPIPKVAFNAVPRGLCGIPTVFDFINNTTGANGFAWNFDNGITSNATNPIVTFTTADTFAVRLIANNQYGCPDTLDKNIITRLAPTADFSVPRGRGCQPYTAIFEDHSTGINGWFWDFGDGTTSNLPNPIHTYSDPGKYDVSLIVNFGNTCFDTIQFADTIRVYPSPVADFIYTSDLNQYVAGTVNFTSQTTPVTGAAHWWDFGDASGISEEKNPTHRYFVNGGKAVQLIVQNVYGCRDTTVKQIIPEYFEGLWVPSALSPESGVGEVQVFQPKGVGIKQYKIQVFTQWGELLWESDRLENGQPIDHWDGMYNGKIMPQDVYVWRCEAVFESGNIWNGMPNKTTGIKSKVGNVTLLR
jgi:large repetitive protein